MRSTAIARWLKLLTAAACLAGLKPSPSDHAAFCPRPSKAFLANPADVFSGQALMQRLLVALWPGRSDSAHAHCEAFAWVFAHPAGGLMPMVIQTHQHNSGAAGGNPTDSIIRLQLDPHYEQILRRAQILTIPQLIARCEEDIIGLPEMTRMGLEQIQERLHNHFAASLRPSPVYRNPTQYGLNVGSIWVSDLGLSERIQRALDDSGIRMLTDLLIISESDLFYTRRMGLFSVSMVKRRLWLLGKWTLRGG